MRLRFTGIAALVAALALSQSGAAAPERAEVIRMGKGIGKIQLGMTLQRVRRAFGRPHATVGRRVSFGSSGSYRELSWELPGGTFREPNVWTIGFRSYSRTGPFRAVRIVTTTRSQRTPLGRLGVGSWPRQIVRSYPNAECVSRGPQGPYPWDWVVVEEEDGGMTAFNLDTFVGADYGGDKNLHKVVGVMVQRDWFSKGPNHRPCPHGWEQWGPRSRR